MKAIRQIFVELSHGQEKCDAGQTDGQTDRQTDRQTDAGDDNTPSAEVAEG